MMPTPEGVDSPGSEATSISGCVALVTGAAKRSGRAIALSLAEQGADLILHYHTSQAEAFALAKEIHTLGRQAHCVGTDLSDSIATKNTFQSIIRETGRLDILINNVGTIAWKHLKDHTDADWQNCLNGTLFATLNASQAALPALRESGRGRIVNILDADADSTDPAPFATAYKIGKRATFTLTKTMAVAEAAHDVTVNAVSPGTLEDSPTKPPLERIPAGRYGTYQDLTKSVLFLVGRGANYVTGAHLKVSGGYLI